tara:strand:+ start:443 stop:847 length:405 start_codon:yes stop_codon:yes gene_type:complete
MKYFTDNPPTLTVGALDAASLLQDKIDIKPKTLPELIIRAVAEFYETNVESLLEPGRDEPRATQRMIAGYMVKKITGISNENLAMLLRRHNQSTISKLMQSVERKVESGKINQSDVLRLNSLISKSIQLWHECD